MFSFVGTPSRQFPHRDRKIGSLLHSLVLWLAIPILSGAIAVGAENTKFEKKWSSKLLLESTEKDHFLQQYNADTGEFLTPARTSRDNFYSGYFDLFLKWSRDLSKKTALDISDSLKLQGYNVQDYDLYDEDSHKYRYTQNVLLLNVGHSFNSTTTAKFDLEHTFYELPVYNTLNNQTGRAYIGGTKNFSKTLSYTSAFEAKIGRYSNQKGDDYDEHSYIYNLYKYIPEKARRVEVFPGAIESKGADGKSNWEYNYNFWEVDANNEPHYYLNKVERGDFYISLDGDYDGRRLLNSTGESYVLRTYGVTLGHNLNDANSIRLSDYYAVQDFQEESDYLYNFNKIYNTSSLSLTSRFSPEVTMNFSLSDTFYRHPNFAEQNYNLLNGSVDFDYHPNRLSIFLSYSIADQNYEIERDYFPNSYKKYGTGVVSYKLNEEMNIKLRDDYSHLDYGSFENSVYSTNNQNIVTLSVDKKFKKHHTVELGYYQLKENNKNFFYNDVTERTIFFNLQSTY